MTKRYELEGPAEKAVETLHEMNYRIVSVQGTNGHDSKNETAAEYLVEMEWDNEDNRVQNLRLLKAYHAGDREHYLEDLRNDVRTGLRHYAAEATGRPSFVLGAKVNKAIDEAVANLNVAIWETNFKGGSK